MIRMIACGLMIFFAGSIAFSFPGVMTSYWQNRFQVAENTFYMDCPAKIGIVKVADDEVVLIDSGSDKDAGTGGVYI